MSVIEMDAWAVGLVGESVERVEPSALPDWNYHQSVRVRTVLRLNLKQVREMLELSASDELASAILWSSSGTALRGRSGLVALSNEGETALELVLSPGQLRQQLQVEAVVALRGHGRSSNPLAPKAAGSVVWNSERYSIDLEGLGSRLPVVAFPFSKRLPSSDAAQWWMHVLSTDLEQPIDSVLWMWLNDEHPHVALMLREPEDERSVRTALHLSNDFYRQLLQMALAHEELAEDVRYPQSSLGEALLALSRLIDPDLEIARAAYKTDPWTVETRLQAAIGFRFD